MHGITNSAQRQIFKKFGADVVFSEMVSSMGIKYENKKTEHKTNFLPSEKPIIVQIFGSTVSETINAARYAANIGADAIDFNCGCPARNMIASGNGGQLLLEPEKLIDILYRIKQAVKIPVSLKTRIGYDEILPPAYYQNIVEQSGIDCLIIHGRTVKQQYRGLADWNHIKKIASGIRIPVIGSGDIVNPTIALDRIANYTPHGIMIGRGALGNPWIFKFTKSFLQNQTQQPTDIIFSKIIKTVLLHTRLQIKEFQSSPYYTTKFNSQQIEQHALTNMRKHFGWYFKGLPHAKELRQRLLLINDYQTLSSTLNKYYE